MYPLIPFTLNYFSYIIFHQVPATTLIGKSAYWFWPIISVLPLLQSIGLFTKPNPSGCCQEERRGEILSEKDARGTDSHPGRYHPQHRVNDSGQKSGLNDLIGDFVVTVFKYNRYHFGKRSDLLREHRLYKLRNCFVKASTKFLIANEYQKPFLGTRCKRISKVQGKVQYGLMARNAQREADSRWNCHCRIKAGGNQGHQ